MVLERSGRKPGTTDDVTPAGLFEEARSLVTASDKAAAEECAALLDRLTKPVGSLGRLEELACQLSSIYGDAPPSLPKPATIAVFAGDHGVVAEGVTPWPSEVTAQMVANFLSGGAAINVFARHAGADVVVVDVGVAAELAEVKGLIASKVRPGTANLAVEAAMSDQDTRNALDAGAQVARDLVSRGSRCLITGDMGIGNTTPSAALIAALSGLPAAEVTGRGTGIDDEHFSRKLAAIDKGLARLRPGAGPFEVLAEVGGLEIAALAGFVVQGAALRVPVIVDGVIALAAALAAVELAPLTKGYLIAGHRSTEPGATIALEQLGLDPLLELDLRLGEGTGACLALPLVCAAAKMAREMATFDSAGVSSKPR